MTDKCKNCNSTRLAGIGGKTSDLAWFEADGKETGDYSYVPYNVGIGGGDYIEFEYCLNCGTIQDEFPIKDNAVQDAFK